CTRILEDAGPFVGVKKLAGEVLGEGRVRESRGIVVLHELGHLLVGGEALIHPVPPEPLGHVAGHRVDAPVQEDAHLGLVVPGRQRTGVQRLPGRLVPRHRRRGPQVHQQDHRKEPT
ncbi:unnamed protein product, partial [Ixodes pacificus]